MFGAFDLVVDSELCGCDLVADKVNNAAHNKSIKLPINTDTSQITYLLYQ
jgi:hypothetical protein